MRFADEVSQSRGTPKATRAMYQSSHVVEGTRCETSRKQEEVATPGPKGTNWTYA